MPKTMVHIAGVGISAASKSSVDKTKSALSAAVKALLDAGLNYDQIDFGYVSGKDDNATKALESLDPDDPRYKRAEGMNLLAEAAETVANDGGSCVLLLSATEVSKSVCFVQKGPLCFGRTKLMMCWQSESIGIVIVSDSFMHRWPYLIDSSVSLNVEASDDVSMHAICQTGKCHSVEQVRYRLISYSVGIERLV
jgi:hypothetical protein